MESYSLETKQSKAQKSKFLRLKIAGFAATLTILVLMTPITSYQEESNTNEKIVGIMGTEENSVSPNSIYVRTFDVVTFVNLDGSNGGTTHNIISVKTGTTEPDGTFYSGMIRTGENFKITLTEPGIYEFFDPIYPNIRGTIHVV